MRSVVIIFAIAILFSCDQHANDIVIKDKDNTMYVNSLEFDIENAQNSLDWDGLYTGIYPCENCEGKETRVIIYPDHTYELISLHQSSKDIIHKEQGSFSWDDSGNIIILDNDDAYRFRVKENSMLILQESDRNTKDYKLIKTNRTK